MARSQIIATAIVGFVLGYGVAWWQMGVGLTALEQAVGRLVAQADMLHEERMAMTQELRAARDALIRVTEAKRDG